MASQGEMAAAHALLILARRLAEVDPNYRLYGESAPEPVSDYTSLFHAIRCARDIRCWSTADAAVAGGDAKAAAAVIRFAVESEWERNAQARESVYFTAAQLAAAQRHAYLLEPEPSDGE